MTTQVRFWVSGPVRTSSVSLAHSCHAAFGLPSHARLRSLAVTRTRMTHPRPLLSLSASPPPLTAPQPTVAAREALHRSSASFACLSLCGLRAYCAPSSSSSSSSSFNLSRIGETHPGPIDSCERRNESIALHDLPGQHEGRHAQRPGQKRPQGMKTHQQYAQVPHTDGRLQRQYLQQPHLRHQKPKPSAFFSGCSSRYCVCSFLLIMRVPFASYAFIRIVSIRTPHDMKQSGMTCHTQSLKVSFFSRYTQPGPGGVQSRFIWLFDGGIVASAPGGSGATAGMAADELYSFTSSVAVEAVVPHRHTYLVMRAVTIVHWGFLKSAKVIAQLQHLILELWNTREF